MANSFNHIVYTVFADPLTSDDLATLVNELYVVRDKWYYLGVQLKVQIHDLDAFQTQYNNNPDKCLLKMLSHWLTMTPPLLPGRGWWSL